jgi:hypothetical protein
MLCIDTGASPPRGETLFALCHVVARIPVAGVGTRASPYDVEVISILAVDGVVSIVAVQKIRIGARLGIVDVVRPSTP